MEESEATPAHEPALPSADTGLLVDPDRAEEVSPDRIDDPIPSDSYHSLPMVGIGGSAGSIAALEAFFRAMPADSGLVFVVILHLAPDRESALPALLGRATKMPVVQVLGKVEAKANSVYVIPPAKLLTSIDGSLTVEDLPIERGQRLAVDLFFRTLADTHGAHCAAIVLSGADGDGAIGVKRIKERGGLTIAQDPDEADHPSMPCAAIATGMVDWVLRSADIPSRLVQYVAQEGRLRLPPEQGPQPARPPRGDIAAGDVDETALRDVLTFLNLRTSRDFSYYKRATIVRRIARRMQVNRVDDLPAYLDFLRTHAGEAGALVQDLLISVTNFFRDSHAFAALQREIPRLFAGKSTGDTLRVWVPACATGEEAYSIAMLLTEHAQTLEAPPALQIFATDLDEDVIAQARDALFPTAITADVSEERLRRFFIKEHRGWRVRREIREVVLFALHDLLKDAPFSRIDLVSCRNLLIYLDREAQRAAVEIMSFALQANGLVFLGASEVIGDTQLFQAVDAKHRLYAARPGERNRLLLKQGTGSALGRSLDAREAARARAPVLPQRLPESGLAQRPGLRSVTPEPGMPAAELHLKLVERLAPPSLVVNGEQDIVHLAHSATQFLEFSGGPPTRNLLRLVKPELRLELRAALSRAVESGSAEAKHVAAALQGRPGWVDIRVGAAEELAPGFLLVTLDWHADDASGQWQPQPPDPAAEQLARELESTRSYVRDVVEQAETAQEELKAGNEELQAMNEELRSATEELETSREELQSINEELTTVNHELKSHVDGLALANSDLQNLMAATAIATIFLDRELRIARYTPSAVELFRLIPTDLGRPLSDLKSQLNYPDIADDARLALFDLKPSEREVRADSRWFLARTLPYRSADDHISGVVLTFLDITARREAEDALRDSEGRFRAIVSQASAGVCHSDLAGRITLANARLTEMTGYDADELAVRKMLDLIHEDDRSRLAALFERLTLDGQPFQTEVRLLRKDGRVVWVNDAVTGVRDAEGRLQSIVAVALDITGRKLAEEALQESNQRMRRATEVDAVGIKFFNNDGVVLEANDSFLRMSGYSRDILTTGRLTWATLVAPESMPQFKRSMAELRERGRSSATEIEGLRRDGSRWWGLHTAALIGSDEGVAYVIDITVNKAAEQSLRLSDERLRLVVENAREYAIVSTDLERYITTWSSGAEQVLGYGQQEAVGMKLDDLFTPEDRAAGAPEAEMRTALAEGRSSDDREHIKKGGTRFWVSGALMPIVDADGRATGFVKIFRDQTAAREVRHALETSRSELIQAVLDSQKARAALETANAARDHFLAVLSHELRTPLTPVTMAAHALARLPGLPDAADGLLAIIQRNVRIETHLIDDLLDLTRLSRKQVEVVRAPMDLHDAVRSAVEISAPDLHAKQQTLKLALDATRSQVDGDQTRLTQALWNLLKNASKFSPAGGTIDVRSRNVDADRIEVAVADNGVGIDGDVLQTIFDPFSQGGDWVTREFGGLGLGLSIANAMVVAHQGVLRAASEGRGRGAAFTIELTLS